RLGRPDIACLILNRTIGTGIFAQPSNVLFLTGSPAVAIILWVFGGLIILSITLSWLELGLTIPRYYIRSEGAYFSTPRSGGDKNYLEYIYKKPRLFMSCLFGITFILFGNLAGNAIQFGIYMQTAISPTCTEDDACFNKAAVLGWAVGILAFCSFLNVATRKQFLRLNNGFAVIKMVLVAAVAICGIIYGTAHGDGCRTNIAWSNRGAGGEFGDIVLATFYGMYSYTGFEQPFYVLAEVEKPKEIFAKYVLLALASVLILFPLANVGYFCVVPYQGPASVPRNMALAFFDIIASGGDPTADTTATLRGVSLMLAFVIFGTIMAQTFTGSRVKQEIGKEAIVPFSLAIATGSDSIDARLRAWWAGERKRPTDTNYIEDHPEQVPMAATLLHIIFAALLVIVVGIPTKPSNAYRILTYLRIFSIIVVLGFLTVAGLAYLKIDSWKNGARQQPGWSPWLDPLPTFLAAAALAFLSIAVFAKPSQIRENEQAVPYWVNPLVGWLVLLLGILWWAGLRAWQWKTRTRTEVYKWPHAVIDHLGNAVLQAEIIEHRRRVRH
ncbi:amino acid/polyamine transporter I, partial [Lasiosphaeris hirsuta]